MAPQAQARAYNHELAQARFSGGLAGLRRDWFIYETEALAIAPGASLTDQINIEADSDFWLVNTMYDANDGAAAPTVESKPVPAVSVLITDTGSGRQLMQQTVPIGSIFGSGEIPHPLPSPRIFYRNSTITVQFSNFSGEIGAGVTYNIRLAFGGYKIYDELRPQSALSLGVMGVR